MKTKEPTWEDFLEICKEADLLLQQLRKFPKAQGRKPNNIRTALIHYLAQKKGINITLHHLFLIYGRSQTSIIDNKKVIRAILEKQKY